MNSSEKTQQIIELLRHRHLAPEWATFAELNIGTGGDGGRFIDFYALNMYPSKRNLKIAYEVKVSRADFAKELGNPRKRESAEKLADECYFVMPVGLVRPDEIPEGWGLLELNAGGLVSKKKAHQRHIKELPLSFTCAIARRASDPPSPLPLALWKWAGKELTAEQVREVAKQELDLAIAEERRKFVDLRDAEQRSKLWELQHIVTEYLGYEYTSPEKLKQWLIQQQAAPVTLVDPKLERDMQFAYRGVVQLQRSLNELMKSLGIQGRL